MFVGVKFHSDGTVSIVKDDFVKGLKLPYDITRTYQVFWSAELEDSPERHFEKFGTIRNVDKKYKALYSSGGHSSQKVASPPSGYYNARIICTADSFDEAKVILESLGHDIVHSVLGKNLSKVAKCKVINAGATASIKDSLYKAMANSLTFTDDEDDEISENMDNGNTDEASNKLQEYRVKIEHLTGSNKDLKVKVAQLESKLEAAEARIAALSSTEEKLRKIKLKYHSVQKEFELSRSLNYKLQEKLIGSLNFIVCPEHVSVSVPPQQTVAETSEFLQIDVPVAKKRVLLNDDLFESGKRHKVLSTEDTSATSSLAPATSEDSSSLLQLPKNYVSPVNGVKSIEGAYRLSDDIIKSSAIGCKFGKAGDKVFVKNLSENLFGKEMLRNSSVTGKKPPTGGKPARPALPKEGVFYIAKLLKERVENSINAVEQTRGTQLTSEERDSILKERASHSIVFEAIGDKIATLRRYAANAN